MNKNKLYRNIVYAIIVIIFTLFSFSIYESFASSYDYELSTNIIIMILLASFIFSLFYILIIYLVSKVRLYRILHDRAVYVFKIFSYILLFMFFVISSSLILVSLSMVYQTVIIWGVFKIISFKTLLYSLISIILIASISIKIPEKRKDEIKSST